VSSKGEPEPYVHAVVADGEVLAPCSCDVVVVGGALDDSRLEGGVNRAKLKFTNKHNYKPG
jgi:hypothetical protein